MPHPYRERFVASSRAASRNRISRAVSDDTLEMNRNHSSSNWRLDDPSSSPPGTPNTRSYRLRRAASDNLLSLWRQYVDTRSRASEAPSGSTPEEKSSTSLSAT